jgi:hypothetical protein
MKRLVIFIAVILCSVNYSVAQITISDLLNGTGGGGKDSRIVVEAVKPALSIIREQYHLEKNGEYFGRKSLPYWGETYTLGVKVSNGTLIQHAVVEPWKYDSDYKRISSAAYKPVHFCTKQKSFRDTNYKDVELELYSDEYIVSLTPDSSVYMHLDKVNDFGLSMGDGSFCKSGYIVWARGNSASRDSTLSMRLECSYFTVDSLSANNTVLMTPNNPEEILGGVFVVPVYEKVGEVRFALQGVVSKRENSDWLLHFFLKDTVRKTEKKDDRKESKSAKDDNDDFTPVKKQK